MTLVKLAAVAISAVSLTGCLNISGVHVLRPYGESDTGTYIISMNPAVHAALSNGREYRSMIEQLERFSRPTTHRDGDRIHIEDMSNTATMEKMYDSYACTAASVPDYMNCRFHLSLDAGETPDWSLDWDVVLQPGMDVVSSNHHRTRTEGGRRHLIWYFDGNRVSRADVDFTVRVPRIR